MSTIGCRAVGEDIVIPDSYNGLPVIGVEGDLLSYSYIEPKTITLPQTLRYIEPGSFSDCITLEKVIFGRNTL